MENILSSEDWYCINELVTKIYSIKAGFEIKKLTPEIKKCVHFDYAMSNLTSNINGKIDFFNYESFNISKDYLEKYYSKYIYLDFIAWYTAVPKPLAYKQTDIIKEKYRVNSIFLTEWMQKIGAYYGAGINLACNNILYGNICLFKSKEHGDFTDRDIKFLEIINNHLSHRFNEIYPNGISYISFNHYIDELSLKYNLTHKEREILTLIGNGTLRHQLANTLFIAENTLKKHIYNIYHKLDIRNYEELLQFIKYDNASFFNK